MPALQSVLDFLHPTQKWQKFRLHICKAQKSPPSILFGYGYNGCCRKIAPMQAKKLAQKPFYAIPLNRIAGLARYRYSKSPLAAAILPEQQKMRALKAFAVIVTGNEFRAFADAGGMRECWRQGVQGQGARRLRPLRRRRLITSRPAGVDMRLKKPCLRARRILLG